MAKLTKKQRLVIESALRELKMARDYLMKDSIAICRTGEANTETTQSSDEFRAPDRTRRRQEYEGKEGHRWSVDYVASLTPVAKGIGSELVGLFGGIRTLERMLEE